MAINLNDNIRIGAGKPSEAKYLNLSNVPYTGTSQVLSQVPIGERHVGLTVLTTTGEYWFATGVTNSDLIVKAGGSGSTVTASNGLSKIGDDIQLGGTLISGTTSINGAASNDSVLIFGDSTKLSKVEYHLNDGSTGGVDVVMNDFFNFYLNSWYVRSRDNGSNYGMVHTSLGAARLKSSNSGNSAISEIKAETAYTQMIASNTGTSKTASVTANGTIGTVSLSATDATTIGGGSTGNQFVVNNSGARMGGLSYIAVSGDSNIIVHLQNGADKIFAYDADYSEDYTDRSLVDKGWVLSVLTGTTGSSSINAGNGLSKVGDTIVLGGALTGATLISGDAGTHALHLGGYNEPDYLQEVIVGATGYITLQTNNYKSYIDVTDTQIELRGNGNHDGGVPAGAIFLNSLGATIIGFGTGATETRIDLSPTLFQLTDNRDIPAGAEYFQDYSANYTDRSLVDKAWVLSQIGGSGSTITGATNGLLVVDGNVELGGSSLEHDTTIYATGYQFNVYNASGVTIQNHGELTDLQIISTNGGNTTLAAYSGQVTVQAQDGLTLASYGSDGGITVQNNGDDKLWLANFGNGQLHLQNTGPVGMWLESNKIEIDAYESLDITAYGNSGMTFLSYGTGMTFRVSENILMTNITPSWQSGFTAVYGTGDTKIERMESTGYTTTLSQKYVDGSGISTTIKSINNTNGEFGLVDVNSGYVNLSGNSINLVSAGNNIVIETNKVGYDATIIRNIADGDYAGQDYVTSATVEPYGMRFEVYSGSTNASTLEVNDLGFNFNGRNLSSGKRHRLWANDGVVNVDGVDNGNTLRTSFRVSATQAKFFDFRTGTTSAGIEYAADYSANYTNRSLVDKAWVLANVGGTGSSVTANNGLTKVGNNIRLGGTLTGNTTISMDQYNLYFEPSSNYQLLGLGTDSNPLSNLEVRVGGSGSQAHIRALDSGSIFIRNFDLAGNSVGEIAMDVLGTNGITVNAYDSYAAYIRTINTGFTFNHELKFHNTGVTFSDFRTGGTASGIQYAADYSASYTNRSLVDKAYVTGLTSSSAKVSVTITGDGSTTSFGVTHNKNTRDVIVQVYDATTYDTVLTDVVRTTVNAVNINFSVAPANAVTYRVVII